MERARRKGAPPPCHPGQRCANPRSRGFTLVELVAAIVILGAIVAVAVPVFRDLRYDARRASLESVRATVIANMNAARTAYLAQGLGPGSTVQVNGKSIEVYGEGAVDIWGFTLPPGAPTAAGLFVMLGCGPSAPTPMTAVGCASLPGITAWTQDSWMTLSLRSDAGGTCYVGCWPPYSFDSTLLGEGTFDAWSRWGNGADIFYHPASLADGGC